MKPAVFLDRDGTIIELVHHLTLPEQVSLIEGAAEGIGMLQTAGYACVVVTNQSVVGRGMIDQAGLDDVHHELKRQLAARGIRLDGIYSCPVPPRGASHLEIEHPDRKPGPGMLLQAAREMRLDLTRSWMIGDSVSDMVAGRLAGCLGTVLVYAGDERHTDLRHQAVDHVAADLRTAATWVISGGSGHRSPVGGQ